MKKARKGVRVQRMSFAFDEVVAGAEQMLSFTIPLRPGTDVLPATIQAGEFAFLPENEEPSSQSSRAI